MSLFHRVQHLATGAIFTLLLPSSGRAFAQVRAINQPVDVTVHAEVARHVVPSSQPNSSGVVVWLTPLNPSTPLPPPAHPPFVLAQKDKQFKPHLLIVPVGSTVDFPNLDPFFHNVFSLFNGKRFDLGLYEGHSRRDVKFDREGVSFIFCNIHPDMGAVVVTLGTPFYAISAANGSITLRGVPPGQYHLHAWAENATPDQLSQLSRTVEVGPQHTDLGTLRIEIAANSTPHHTNKFGEAYKPVPQSPY